MTIEGARVYDEGVEINHDCEERVRQIVNVIKNVTPDSDISLRLLKTGNVYEALLWGKANHTPIGVYIRGLTMSHVLDNLSKRVKRECIKINKLNRRNVSRKGKPHSNEQTSFAVAC